MLPSKVLPAAISNMDSDHFALFCEDRGLYLFSQPERSARLLARLPAIDSQTGAIRLDFHPPMFASASATGCTPP